MADHPENGGEERWHRSVAAAVARRLPLLIISAGIAAYLNSFSGVFLFDGAHQIVGNDRIRQLSPLGPMLASRRPVVELTLAVNYAAGGLDPWGYHLVNLTIHLLAALTLFGVVRRTLASTAGGERLPAGDPCAPDERLAANEAWLAGAVALLWVVHPVPTQAVVYVVQRSESLMALFYLLALYGLIRGAEARRSLGWYTLSVAACALGMGTKAVMITAPVALLLYDRIFLAGSFKRMLRARALLHIALMGTWSVLWLCGVAPGVLGLTDKPSHVGFAYAGVSPLNYLLTQFGVMVHYLRLSIWPRPLCLDYGWPIARTVAGVAAPALIILSLLAATLWALRRRPRFGWTAACFFLILAPTSTIIPIRDPIFEHRLYLSLACVLAVVVIGTHTVLSVVATRLSWKRGVTVAIGLALMLPALLLCGRATWARNRAYHAEVTMWQDVVRKRPGNTRAHLSLGNALLAAKTRIDEAADAFRRAAKTDPLDYETYYGLGSALLKGGHDEEAARAFRQALKARPGHVDSYWGLGVALMHLGDLSEAEQAFRDAIAAKPDLYQAYYNLGNVLTNLGRTEEAIEAYRACVRIKPDFADALTNLGIRLGETGELYEAEAAFRKALKSNPNHAKAHFNYGLLLANQGHPDKAIASFRSAILADPQYARAHYNLGVVLWQKGLTEEAARQFRETLRINPNHAGALRALDAVSAPK